MLGDAAPQMFQEGSHEKKKVSFNQEHIMRGLDPDSGLSRGLEAGRVTCWAWGREGLAHLPEGCSLLPSADTVETVGGASYGPGSALSAHPTTGSWGEQNRSSFVSEILG